jgi:hypothetical protein
MRDDDARVFLDVHHAAVRHIAARDYPPEVIEAWHACRSRKPPWMR